MQGYEIIILNHLNFNQVKNQKSKNQKVKNQKEIIVPIMYYIDDETNRKVYDIEEMTAEFERELSALEKKELELGNDLYERSAE